MPLRKRVCQIRFLSRHAAPTCLALLLTLSCGMATAAEFIPLGTLPGRERSEAFSVSDDGTVVAGHSYSSAFNDMEAFRWTDETGMVGLGVLPGHLRSGNGINGTNPLSADGSTIVGRSFALDGWNLIGIQSVSANGQYFAGNTINPSGDFEAFLVRLDAPWGSTVVPEPTTGAIALLALVPLAVWRTRRAGRTLAALLLVVTTINFATAAEFIPLGMEIPVNIYYPEVVVAEDGSVVVGGGKFGGTQSEQLLRWTRKSGTQVLLENASDIASISGDGITVVASRRADSGFQAIKLTETGIEVFPTLPNITSSEARLISQDGSTVFGYTGSWRDPQWFRWTEQGVSSMPDLGYPAGISATGDILAFQNLKRWSEASGVKSLPVPPNTNSATAFGLSSDGRWTVGRIYQQSGGPTDSKAVRWDGLSAPEFLLAANAGWGSAALDITADGMLAVGTLAPTDEWPFVAGVWKQETGWISLQEMLSEQYGLDEALQGWHLTGVYDVTDDGRYMVGHAINPLGNDEAFLVSLVPVPEPSTAALALLALGPLAVWRTRRSTGRGNSSTLIPSSSLNA